MNWELKISKPAFQELVARLAANPLRLSVCPAGLSRLPGRTEFLTHTVGIGSVAARDLPARVVVTGSSVAGQLANRVRAAAERPPVDPPAAFLALGVGPAAGHIAGACLTTRGLDPLQAVTILAEGLPRAALNVGAARGILPHLRPDPGRPELMPETTIWSRTIGALGEAVWRRLTSLHFCIVGCGRTGSLAATSLRRLGVRQITLLDPDVLEPHNIGEMDAVMLEDVGQPKVEAVAAALDSLLASVEGNGHAPENHSKGLPHSALSLSALVAAKQADFLVCCVDNDAARLATGLLAKLYLKPLLDIGTGVLGADGATRRMGADVRLILPERCVVCFGGVNRLEQACEQLAGDGGTVHVVEDWRQERAGSLRSLNMVAVGHGLRLVEDFVAGRVAESTWLQLDFNGAAPTALTSQAVLVNPRCPACRVTGHGDSGVPALPDLLHSLAG